MNKLYSSFVILFIIIISLSFVSSKFVCGFVNDSQEFSSSWTKVRIYAEEKPLSPIECKVNPEKKYCCDLDEIPLFNSLPGKRVFAEVLDREAGFVAGPVNLYLTQEGYDVFPQMNLQKAIKVDSPTDKLFVNKSSITINGSIFEGYNNLKYTLNSSQGFSEQQVCTNCNNFVFSIPLVKGKNDITLIAYNGSKNISENIVLYNLDYFNFNIKAICNKCTLKKGILYIPSGKEFKFISSFNSSHNLSGDFLFYFPSNFISSNSLSTEDFSITHKVLSENISNLKEFSANYTFNSPKTLIKEYYILYQKFDNKELATNVSVLKSKLIPFHKSKPFQKTYFSDFLIEKASQNEPIILNARENSLKLAAIFPKKDIPQSYSSLIFYEEGKKNNKKYFLTILTSIPQKDIEKILLIFKAEKGKSIEVYNNEYKISLEFYEEDSNYTYYSAIVHEKGPFNIKVF